MLSEDKIVHLGNNYFARIWPDDKIALIFVLTETGGYVGKIWIGKTGEWNVKYADGVGYLPISETLYHLGYKGEQHG